MEKKWADAPWEFRFERREGLSGPKKGGAGLLAQRMVEEKREREESDLGWPSLNKSLHGFLRDAIVWEKGKSSSKSLQQSWPMDGRYSALQRV